MKRTGKTVLVTRKGELIALVVPPPPPAPQRWLGCMKDDIRITGDIVSPAAETGDWEMLGG